MLSPHQMYRLIQRGQYQQLIERIIANGRPGATGVIDLLRYGDGTAGGAAAAGRRLIMAGLGLGVQRLCELIYAPSDAADDLAARLTAMVSTTRLPAGEDRLHAPAANLSGRRGQSGDYPSPGHGEVASNGRMPTPDDPLRGPGSNQTAPHCPAAIADLVAEAIAVRGLLAWAELAQRAGRTPDLPIDLHNLLDNVSERIARHQGPDGLISGDPIASAAICWQLGDQPAFRVQVRTDALLRALRDKPVPDDNNTNHGNQRNGDSLMRLAWATAA